MTTAQTRFSEHELLADHEIEAPLVVDGLRCHGGFDAAGAYVSGIMGRHGVTTIVVQLLVSAVTPMWPASGCPPSPPR